MSDSVRLQRLQPSRLPHPWDSQGKNTGVGCHFLLQCMKVKSESKVAQSCLTLSDPMDCSLPSSSIHGIFQTRVLEWGAIAFSHGEEENPMDRGVWSATVHGISKSWTQLKQPRSLVGLQTLKHIPPAPCQRGHKDTGTGGLLRVSEGRALTAQHSRQHQPILCVC